MITVRLASVAVAFVLGAAAPATSASAQESRSFFGMSAWVLGDQEATANRNARTTGSVAPRYANSPAKRGNPGQQDRRVPQYGNSSGGPAD